MNMKQAGFTLIELVMVIVILGILAAVAVPKFIDLSSEAKDAAVKGVAGALASGMATNYAARLAGTQGIAITNCQDITSSVTSIPSGAAVTSTALSASGVTATCTVTLDSKTATFVGIGA